jgi:curved DNA-binding protein CbpA
VAGNAFVDYYELLQVSPNADEETIQRVFRHLAKKHHPDAAVQGDAEQFNRLLDAYRTLTDVQLRAAYDVSYQRHWHQTWQVAAEAAAAHVVTDDSSCRERLLSLFYAQRRRDMRSPGLGQVELERVMDMPREHLAFHLWYLREKGWLQRLDNGQLAITSDGVDQAEQYRVRVAPGRLIEQHPRDDAGRAPAADEAPAAKRPLP